MGCQIQRMFALNVQFYWGHEIILFKVNHDYDILVHEIILFKVNHDYDILVRRIFFHNFKYDYDILEL
jgi:hypothetical protein